MCVGILFFFVVYFWVLSVSSFLKSHNVSKWCLHFTASNFEFWSVNEIKLLILKRGWDLAFLSDVYTSLCSFTELCEALAHGLVQTLT